MKKKEFVSNFLTIVLLSIFVVVFFVYQKDENLSEKTEYNHGETSDQISKTGYLD